MNAQTIKVYRNELEPGTHICRKAVGRELIAEIVLPFDDCSEVRGDWGCWSPVVTIQAVARTLRRLNVLPFYSGPNEEFVVSIADVSA